MIGFAVCGSYCTHSRALAAAKELTAQGYELLPILSENVQHTDTRFGSAEAFREELEKICGQTALLTIAQTEPLGPKIALEALVIAPCTGNTLAKIANGITDTPVTMAAKAHLRSGRPLLLALASNDAMSANLGNLAKMLCRKHVYFVPMVQDDPVAKPDSLVAEFTMLPQALRLALCAHQMRPLFLTAPEKS